MEISSPDVVEASGAVLVWGKETVSREGLRKQTTAQQNKNTKENTLLLCDFRVAEQRLDYCSRSWEQELLEKVRKSVVEFSVMIRAGGGRPVKFCYNF